MSEPNLQMRDDRLEIGVSYDPRRGYFTTGAELPTTVALSLAGLRKRIEAALLPDDMDMRLVLDRAARHERDRRRRGSAAEQSDSPVCPPAGSARADGSCTRLSALTGGVCAASCNGARGRQPGIKTAPDRGLTWARALHSFAQLRQNRQHQPLRISPRKTCSRPMTSLGAREPARKGLPVYFCFRRVAFVRFSTSASIGSLMASRRDSTPILIEHFI